MITPKTKQAKQGTLQNRSRIALVFILCSFGGFLLLAAGAIWFIGSSPPSQEPLALGGPFILTNGDGRTVTDLDFRGKYMLIYFGYTFCPDVCPTTLQNVTVALERLGPKSAVIQPLFVTVDPQRDIAPVVKQYAAAFSPRLIGLTGTADQIKQVEELYHVYAQQRPAKTNGEGYSVDHSSVLYLMGPDGRFLAALRADETSSAIASDLEQYAHLSQEKV